MNSKLLVTLMMATLTAPAPAQQVTAEELANRVRSEFLHAWNGYKKYAWGHDALRPLSKTPEDRFGTPFYLTALEALDGLNLMRLDREADSTRQFLATHLSFDKNVYVPTAEFAARVLGALIANYQLSTDTRLLDLADDLGTRLLPAFVSATGMPYHEVNLKTGEVRGEACTPEDIANLFIDFGALAHITQKAQYYNHPKIALLSLYERRSSQDLVGDTINITTGEWSATESRLNSGMGGFTMAMLKCAYLLNDSDCVQMWQTYSTAITRCLLDSTATGYWYGQADMQSGKRTNTIADASDALFFGAQGLARDLDRADRAMQSAFSLWNKFGMPPKQYDYAQGTVKDPRYSFNPEIAEATYSLYRMTGNPVYLHMGKAFLDSTITYCKTEEGYAELENVITKKKADRIDLCFFSGTMKFIYLLFATPDVLDFASVVMNSQGHPIRKAW